MQPLKITVRGNVCVIDSFFPIVDVRRQRKMHAKEGVWGGGVEADGGNEGGQRRKAHSGERVKVL